MLTWNDVFAAVGLVLLTNVFSILFLMALLVVGHGVTCCWEPLGWILAGMRQIV